MKFTQDTLTVNGTESNNRLTISHDDVDKAASILIGLYGSAVTPVREIIVNAMEANADAGADSPVSVVFDTKVVENNLLGHDADDEIYSQGTITITDHGYGMSEEFANTRFRSLTNSTKDKDDSGIGGFGIGSKSVMHIANTAVWRSTTPDGMTTTIIMSRSAGDGFDIDVSSTHTGNEQGTIVSIPVNKERMNTIIRNIDATFFDYADPSTMQVTIAGEDHAVGASSFSNMNDGDVIVKRTDYYNVYSNNKSGEVIVLAQGNVPYTYRVNNLMEHLSDCLRSSDNINLASGNYVVRIDLGRNHITPTRESLKESKELDMLIVETIRSYYNDFKAESTHSVTSAQTIEQWRDAVSEMYSIPNNGHNDTNSILSFSTSMFHDMGVCSLRSHRYYNDRADSSALMRSIMSHDNIVETSMNRTVPRDESVSIANIIGDRYSKSVYLSAYLDDNDVQDDLSVGALLALGYGNLNSRPWWFPQFLDFNTYSGDMKGLVSTLFDVTVVTVADMRERAMDKGKEIVKNNPSAMSTAKKTTQASPLSIIDFSEKFVSGAVPLKEVDAVGSIRERAVNDDVDTVFYINNYDLNTMSECVFNHLKNMNVIVVSGDNAMSRINRSFQATTKRPAVRASVSVFSERKIMDSFVDSFSETLSQLKTGYFSSETEWASRHAGCIYHQNNRYTIDGVGFVDYVLNKVRESRGDDIVDAAYEIINKATELFGVDGQGTQNIEDVEKYNIEYDVFNVEYGYSLNVSRTMFNMWDGFENIMSAYKFTCSVNGKKIGHEKSVEEVNGIIAKSMNVLDTALSK